MQITQKLRPLIEKDLGNVLIIGCLTLMYAPIMIHWIDGWLNKNINIEHEYFSHGLIGLPYATYLVFNQNSKKWETLDNKINPLGGFLLGVGIVFYITGSIELVNLSFPIILGGILLWLKGMPGLKLNGFPLLLVLLATPNSIPYLLTPYTLPLQKFIAGAAGFILMQFGAKVNVDGIYLYVNNIPVEVAPYCAGLKMLFTGLYVSLLLLHWSGKIGDKKRVVSLLICAVFISVGANIIRNTLLAMFHGTGNQQAFDSLHEGTGGDIYSVIMLGIIVGVNSLMDKISIKPQESLELESENSHE